MPLLLGDDEPLRGGGGDLEGVGAQHRTAILGGKVLAEGPEEVVGGNLRENQSSGLRVERMSLVCPCGRIRV